MRKKEYEITDLGEIEAILMKADVCRLAMTDGAVPYIVPLNFGYRDRALYFHTGHAGKKIDILKKNNIVCFEVDMDAELISADTACGYGMKYRSVVGAGRAQFVEDREGKREALDIIMGHYSERKGWDYRENSFERTCIIKVAIETMTGRKAG
ncbi:MAG: pyridoxamine 5'-phosphate oxidase family protein [Spirochaetes bacterium]|nr:pyridoxamine 5'-phosphate oxidase family protein [Spirochaetota bacterium]